MLGKKDDVELKIGQLSREFGVTLRALRLYEEKGLISPQRTAGCRGGSYDRLYSIDDRIRLSLILDLKACGFGLKEINELLKSAPRARTIGGLRLPQSTLRECLDVLTSTKSRVSRVLAYVRKRTKKKTTR